jgi:hypothetical protein
MIDGQTHLAYLLPIENLFFIQKGLKIPYLETASDNLSLFLTFTRCLAVVCFSVSSLVSVCMEAADISQPHNDVGLMCGLR